MSSHEYEALSLRTSSLGFTCETNHCVVGSSPKERQKLQISKAQLLADGALVGPLHIFDGATIYIYPTKRTYWYDHIDTFKLVASLR